jgi:hypothetical protein
MRRRLLPDTPDREQPDDASHALGSADAERREGERAWRHSMPDAHECSDVSLAQRCSRLSNAAILASAS